jgi:ketosteroid isomerase-like protein
LSQEENKELVKRMSEALVRRNIEACVECFHPSVEFILPRNILEGGSYRGLDGVRRALADTFETWEDYRFHREDIRAIGDYVVWWGRATVVAKGRAPAVEYQAAYVAKIQQGKIIKLQPYRSKDEALKAVGIEE